MPSTLILITTDPADDAALEKIAAEAGLGASVRHFLRTDTPDSDLPTPPDTSIVGAWIASPPPPALVDGARRLGERVEAYLTSSRHQWTYPDEGEAAGTGEGPRPVRMAFITRPGSIDHAEFDRRWLAHAAVAKAHQPYIVGYVQH